MIFCVGSRELNCWLWSVCTQ